MKSKFFLCIRPVVAEPVEEEDGEERRYVVVSKGRSGDRKIMVTERSSSDSCCSGKEDLKVAAGGGGGHRRRQRAVGGGGSGSHKTFSQAIKAVLFEVSLRKSVREKQCRQLMPRSISQSNTHLVGSNNIEPVQSQPELQQQPQPISRTPSLSSLNSLNHPKTPTISNNEVNNSSSLNYVIYLVVISLFVTIFWGKIIGIFCTSIWMLYVGPCRSYYDGDRRLGSCSVKLPETEEEMVEYKKRVIMGGMLERNNRRDRERELNF